MKLPKFAISSELLRACMFACMGMCVCACVRRYVHVCGRACMHKRVYALAACFEREATHATKRGYTCSKIIAAARKDYANGCL